MGEDKFGTKRGMCALCEDCKEYTKPTNNSQSCDYCDHKPVYHIEVIQLGACICNDCDGYTSPTLSKASECEYCGCPAPNHKGWDQIQRQVEKIKNRSAKPTGAIESVVTKPISAPPQPNPSTMAQGMHQIPDPQPNIQFGGGIVGYNNPPSQPQVQAQYTKQQSQPGPQGAAYGNQFSSQPLPQQPAYNPMSQGMTSQGHQHYPNPGTVPQHSGMPAQGYPPQHSGMPAQGYQPQHSGMPAQGHPPQHSGMPAQGHPPQHSGMPAQGHPSHHSGMPAQGHPQQQYAMPQHPPNSSSSSSSSGQAGGYAGFFTGTSGADKCKNPNCTRSKRAKEDGSGFYDFCGRTCAKQCP